MKRVLELLDAVPSWLRWLLFLPIGFWLAGNLEHLIDGALGLTAADRAPNVAGTDLRIYLSKVLSAIAFTALPALLSPRPWGVGIVLVACWTLLASVPIAYRISVGYVPSQVLVAVAAAAADVLGAFLGLWAVWWLVRRRVREPEGSSDHQPTIRGASGRPTRG
jgi:hypothetical protein